MTPQNYRPSRAFSLVEVVLAIAITSFVLIAILGLFTTGMQSTRESEQQIQAANLASTIIAMREASPTGPVTNLPAFAIPAASMSGPYGPVFNGNAYVGADGQTNSTVSSASIYQISCSAGTTAITGSSTAQVYLMLSWPPQASPATAAGRYEIITDIPLR